MKFSTLSEKIRSVLFLIKHKLRRFAMIVCFIFVALAGLLSGLIDAYMHKYKLGRYKD